MITSRNYNIGMDLKKANQLPHGKVRGDVIREVAGLAWPVSLDLAECLLSSSTPGWPYPIPTLAGL